MSFKINKDNYDDYKKVLDIVWQHLYKRMDAKMQLAMSEHSPIERMTKWENEIPKSKLYSGLRQALCDCVAMMKDDSKFTEDINADLKANSLPSFQKLKGLVADSANKVIKRQKIKNIDEYYIIKELIDDTVSDITNDERTLLSKLIADFETKITNR